MLLPAGTGECGSALTWVLPKAARARAPHLNFRHPLRRGQSEEFGARAGIVRRARTLAGDLNADKGGNVSRGESGGGGLAGLLMGPMKFGSLVALVPFLLAGGGRD